MQHRMPCKMVCGIKGGGNMRRIQVPMYAEEDEEDHPKWGIVWIYESCKACYETDYCMVECKACNTWYCDDCHESCPCKEETGGT